MSFEYRTSVLNWVRPSNMPLGSAVSPFCVKKMPEIASPRPSKSPSFREVSWVSAYNQAFACTNVVMAKGFIYGMA